MPQDSSDKLWRYMDLAQYLALIQTEHLYFTRGDQFDDPFEGSYPIQNLNDFDLENHNGEKSEYAENMRKNIAISCWHKSESESDAMWRLYTPPGQGIVVTTTVPKLTQELDSHGYVIPVKYIDFMTETVEIDTPAFVFDYKRKAFTHEQEVRAIINNMWDGRNPIMNGPDVLPQPPDPKGMRPEDQLVEVNLVDLIKNIIVSPNSKPWFLNVVQRVTKSSSLKHINVKPSCFSADPVYANISI